MTTIRIAAAVLFFVAMLGVREFAHVVVDAGALAWLAAMTGIFLVGLRIENRDRAAAGRPPYSWADARSDLAGPLSVLGAVLLVAWVVR
jgi:hypothetical protein